MIIIINTIRMLPKEAIWYSDKEGDISWDDWWSKVSSSRWGKMMTLYIHQCNITRLDKENSNETTCEPTDPDSRPLLKTNSLVSNSVSCNEEKWGLKFIHSHAKLKDNSKDTTCETIDLDSFPLRLRLWCQCSPGCSHIPCIAKYCSLGCITKNFT